LLIKNRQKKIKEGSMRILKKTLKILSISIISIIVFLLLLVGGAKIFENELAAFTMERLEKQIDAPLSIGKVSLIPLFSLPRFSAEINDLWIGEPENKNGDTLFCFSSLKVGLDSWDLIHGIYTIDKVEISGLNFDYIVDKKGNSNIDFLINAFSDTTITTKTNDSVKPLNLSAQRVNLENIRINYYDSLNLTGLHIHIPEIKLKAKAKNDIYKGKTEGSFVLTNCLFKETKLNQMKSCIVDFDLEYEDKYAIINNLLINSEGITLSTKGTIQLGDTIDIIADLEANNLNLDILKKYIPEKYFKEYGILDIKGLTDISAKVKGQFADSSLLPQFNADLKLKNLSLKTKEYPEIKSLNLTANINSNDKTDISKANIKISKLDIKTPVSSVFVMGSIKGLKNSRYNINSKLDINLAEFKDYLPDSLIQNLNGNLKASISTKGILPNKITAKFTDYLAERTTLSMELKNISALLKDSLTIDNFNTNINYLPQDSGRKNVQIDNLLLKSEALNIDIHNTSLTAILTGKVSDPLKMDADLPSFRFQNGNNLMEGNAKISKFEAPEFDINTNINIRLNELMSYVPDSLINNMSGNFKASIHSKGRINPDSINAQLFPLIFENSHFDLSLENISLQFPDTIMNIDSISANISLKNDELKIDKLSTIYNGLSLKMDSTIVQNIYKAVLLNQKEELYVKTQIEIGDIFFDDFKHLLALASSNTMDTNSVKPEIQADTNSIQEAQNWSFLIHGKASVKSIIIDSTELEGFNINRLHINNFSTLFKLTDSAYIVDQFKFKAFEGEMNNSFHYKKRDDGTQSVSSHNVIKEMNIRTLLRDMDNFGMDSVISYENISGLFSTDLNAFLPIDGSVLINKTMLSGDITLEQGGVYDYAPAEELSKFSGIKELNNIQFKTLNSNIFMFKNKLYVPRTNIVSNAIDIAAFGMQSMGADYEYHLEIHLSNILFGKSKRRNKKQDASGDEVDEKSLKKSSHKLRYADMDGKSKVGWDTKDSRDKMTNKIRVQEKMLQFIFFPKNIHYNTDVYKKH
jgi:hypothetical protein